MTGGRGTRWCRIVVRGELGDRYATQFDGLTLTRGDGVSTFVGTVADQAHVYGLLERVQDLGLDLVSVDTVDAANGVVPSTYPEPVPGSTGPVRASHEQRG
jgi:hypothetical protein